MASRDKKLTGNKHLTQKKETDTIVKCGKLANEEKEADVVTKPKRAAVGVKKGIWKRKLTSVLVSKHKNFNQIKKRQRGAKSLLDGPIPDNLTGSDLIVAQKKRIRKRKLVLDDVNTKLKQNPPKLVREDEEDSITAGSKDTKLELLSVGVTLTNCLSPQRVPIAKNLSESVNLSPAKSDKSMPVLKKRIPVGLASQKDIDSSTESSEKHYPEEDSIRSPLALHLKPKLRGRLKGSKSAVNPDLRNGTKIRASPYTTRSGHLLRNGKHRKFKEPLGLDGMVVKLPRKRKRLLSSTTDGSNVDSLNSSLVDGDSKMRIGSESDSSCLDSLQQEYTEWDSDIDIKPSDIALPVKILRRNSSPIFSNGESLESSCDKSLTNRRVTVTERHTNTQPDGDSNDADVFEDRLEAVTADGPQKIDSNSNLYEISKRSDGSSNSSVDITKNKLKPMANKLTKEKSSTITKLKSPSDLLPLEQLSAVPLSDVNHFLSKDLEAASLPGDGSSIPPGDRSITPDMRQNSDNWETISVNSTPSSKNFDASFDDVSEKDFSTDCENGKDVRRSQRSSIRKTRAALLKLATTGKRSGKPTEKADADLLDENESEVPSDKPDESTDVESLMDASLMKSEIDTSVTDVASVKGNLDNVDNINSTYTESELLFAVRGRNIEPNSTSHCESVAMDSVSSMEKGSEVSARVPKKLSDENILDLVSKELLATPEERQVPKLEQPKTMKSTLISSTATSEDHSKFTLPVSKKRRLISPKATKKNTKNLSVDLIPAPLSKDKRDATKIEPKSPLFESNNLKSELKVEISPETSIAVGDAAIASVPVPDSLVKVHLEMPALTDSQQCMVDETIGFVQELFNMEEEINLIEAELRKKVEMKEFKENADGGNAMIHVSVADLMKDDVAEKLREMSMKFQDDSDIFPSLNIKKSVVEEMEEKSNESMENVKDSPPAVSQLLLMPDVSPAEKMEVVATPDKVSALQEVSASSQEVAASSQEVAASSQEVATSDDETPEQKAIKESIFSALGLQSLEAARLAKIANVQRVRYDATYTGTLKTVIKVQRSPEKRTRPSKMKLNSDKKGDGEMKMNGFQYSIQSKDPGYSIEEPGTSTSSGFGNHISSNPQLFVEDKVEEEESVVEEVDAKDEEKAGGVKQNLVIPEKASSFSIHPGRLCSDVCTYCCGKFGSLDTPCHIAQLKGSDRQVKILQTEVHLTAESCLCDACYRHVDRKANCPSYKEKTKTKSKLVHHMSRAARPKSSCCVQGCVQPAQHHVRRKWLTKLKRSIGKKVPVITSKLPQHTSLPLCSQHFAWVDHFMVCGICRRRLNCNQMYLLGPEVHEINTHLAADRIPVRLTEKVFLCKLCRYFTTLRMKFPNKAKLGGSNRMFYESYRKKIFQGLDVEIPEDTDEQEMPKVKRRKLKALLAKAAAVGEVDLTESNPSQAVQPLPVINLTSRGPLSPPSMDISDMVETQLVEPMIDYSNLPSPQPHYSGNSFAKPTSLATGYRVELARPTKIRLKMGNVEIGKVKPKDNRMTGGSVSIEPRHQERLTNVTGTPELSINANFDFNNPIVVRSDSEGEWEKCKLTLQYDRDSKIAFEKLKRPYGSQSSFFRHLLLLEQYWRSGELTPSTAANPRTKTYLKSVQARIDSFSKSSTFHFQSTYNPPIPNVPKVQNAPATVTATSSASTSTNPMLPVIDLPIRRRLSGGVMATPPLIRPPTPTSAYPTSGGSLISPGSSSNPLFVSQVPKKFVINPATGQMVAAKRKPNIVQVTKGGQPLFRLVDPTKSQIRALQGYKRKVQSSSTVTSAVPEIVECTPMICDVRSLATEGTAKLWNVPPTTSATETSGTKPQASVVKPQASVVKPQALSVNKVQISVGKPQASPSNKPQKLHVSILPKPPQGVGPKPNTVVTPTGIILSKKLDISVSPVVNKRPDGPSKT